MLNDTVAIDRQMLEETICDLSSSKELLIRERDQIENRIKALGERIQALQARLEQPSRNSAGKGVRFRKGEGIGTILKVLNGVDGLGMTQAQISEKTGIPTSTVSRILAKNENRFAVGPDNLWRKKVQ